MAIPSEWAGLPVSPTLPYLHVSKVYLMRPGAVEGLGTVHSKEVNDLNIKCSVLGLYHNLICTYYSSSYLFYYAPNLGSKNNISFGFRFFRCTQALFRQHHRLSLLYVESSLYYLQIMLLFPGLNRLMLVCSGAVLCIVRCVLLDVFC